MIPTKIITRQTGSAYRAFAQLQTIYFLSTDYPDIVILNKNGKLFLLKLTYSKKYLSQSKLKLLYDISPDNNIINLGYITILLGLTHVDKNIHHL